jgi:hypothetical protein
MLHHLVHYAVDPRGRMVGWLAMRCPWMPRVETEQLLEHIIAHPRRFKADTLAAKLNLTAADRARWKITTIGAIDLLREQRVAARRQRDRQRKISNRRARGVQRRAEWEASHNTNRDKPWIVEGISRRTWYRRQHGTGPATAYPL